MTLFGLIRRFQYAILVGSLAVVVGASLGSTQNKEECGVMRDYDVFLSFRGADTRTGFTDFLYHSLVAESVRAFRDEDDLPMGEEIFGGLIQGISRSKILIPIISKNYANSGSCLRELAKMIKRREVCGQLIFPVFYKVSVDEVQGLKGRVGEALDSLNDTVDADTMSQWEEALRSVAKIKGWESHKIANGHEGALVTMIVAKVLSELKSISCNSARLNNIINWSIRAVHHLVRKRSGGAENRCQVFLNFYDEDTGTSFTDYLYISLVNARVLVFSVDDQSLIGKDFAEEVHIAIKNCKIFILIISKHYASSIWSLRELVQMMDRKKRTGQKLIPIFYKLKPSQVREVKNEFKEALTSHRANGFHESVVAEWEQALRAIGASKGLESKKIADGHEGKLVKLVVAEVLSELSKGRNHNSVLCFWCLQSMILLSLILCFRYGTLVRQVKFIMIRGVNKLSRVLQLELNLSYSIGARAQGLRLLLVAGALVLMLSTLIKLSTLFCGIKRWLLKNRRIRVWKRKKSTKSITDSCGE